LQPFDVVLAENGLPRFDLFDFRPNGIEKAFFQNAGLGGTFVTIVLVNILSAKNEVFERR